ncbi:putative CAP Gly-rich domain-containing protein [Plasmopara halstedii]
MELEVGARVAFGAGRTGIVRFVGETDFASGEWVGIELDQPEGKNNGELNGRVYFTCAPDHGLFVKKSMVRTLLSSASSAVKTPSIQRLSSANSVLSGTGSLSSSPSVSTVSRLSAPRTRSSVIAPSSRSSISTTSATKSRLSLDKRSSIGSATSGSSLALDDQLIEAKARINKLEEELEQKSRHVEQLRQSVVVMKEAVAANNDKNNSLEQQDYEDIDELTPKNDDTQIEADGDEAMQEVNEIDIDNSEYSREQLAQQIENIRGEAEEHVRSVRAELEDHIAELTGEHDEQIDELRLENATQASEIKTLEAEVAQQKTRIAAFTAAEQKKAEEVAMAVAKASSGARKVEVLEKQVAELHDMIELMTLEKETIEMDKEIAEEHAEDLQQEVEKLKAAMALSATTGPAYAEGSPGNVGGLADENNKLRAAVKMLHERASEEKAELSKKLRQAQRENAELVSLREEVEELSTTKSNLQSEMEELKEMLDLANAYESMVEELTEKNLNLGEKLAELETTVQSLESLREVDQEMEHQHTEYEAELRAEIDTQRAMLQEFKQAALDQKTVVEDKERTIARFRDLAHSHREEIAQLKAKLRAETGAVESLKDTAHLALNQSMGLRSLVAAAREHETEAARQKIIAEQARIENSFLCAVVPSSIFSETDQKILRVRLTLGRIAGKSDILVRYLKKELESIAQQQHPSSQLDNDKDESVPIAAISVEQLDLGVKLAAVSCQVKEDLFMLECHLTTEEEFAQGCAALDTSQTSALENSLDLALSAFSEGALLKGSRSGGDGASLYDRFVQTLEEWHSSRILQVSRAPGAESFGARTGVLKLRTRKSVAKLAFSIASMVVFLRATMRLLASSSMPNDDHIAALRTQLMPVLDQCLGELLSVLSVAQSFYRRAEIDLAASDDDLDGLVAAGGEVVSSIQSYATEAQSLAAALQVQLAEDGLLDNTRIEELMQFTRQNVYEGAVAFKEKVALLFKLVCRGAFTDSVAPRTRNESSDGSNGRPQWRIRAQIIHQELLDASTLRSNLSEMTELCNALHQRIRDLERSDSQHRVVAQKLESHVLQLTETVAAMTSEKTQLEAQLAKEREQFDVALDESNKEKTLLNSLNRDLRKQLKRTSDAGSSNKSGSAGSNGPKGSTLSAGDAEAFRQAFQYLHAELHSVRATLANERLMKILGPSRRRNSTPKPSDQVAKSLKDVATFARQVKAQLSMPRLVDLRRTADSLTDTSPHSQLVTEKLQQSRIQRDLTALRERVGAAMREDGWSPDVTNAIARGESVFGWQPPEIERPPVLLGRVKLGTETTTTTQHQLLQVVLNSSETFMSGNSTRYTLYGPNPIYHATLDSYHCSWCYERLC